MAEDVATIVACEGCGERVAAILADDGRVLCGECYMREIRIEHDSSKETDADK